MPQAILIGGNAARFMDVVRDLRSYLVKEVGIGPKRIREFPTAYASEDMLECRIGLAASERTKVPLFILYAGHGGETGWACDDSRTLTYRQLAEAIRPGKRPIVIVNDCCNAMAIVPALEEAGVDKDRVSVIAASENGETTYSGLLIGIMLNGWRQRRPVRFGPELRWGAQLDHHFFPKPAQ